MEIIGRKENIVLKLPTYKDSNKVSFKLVPMVAKIDSGAYNNSMHVKKITLNYYNDKIKDYGVLITMDNNIKFFIKNNNFIYKDIKSSNGKIEKRIQTKLKIKIGDKTYLSTFTFSNREGMRNKILLGRQILKDRFLIDVNKTFLLDK